MVSDAEIRGYNYITSGANRVLPLLARHKMMDTHDKLQVLVSKLKTIIPMLRDTELLNETGCCCGEIRGKRNNRDLCEACEQRAGNGGQL